MSKPTAAAVLVLLLCSVILNGILLSASPFHRRSVAVQMLSSMGSEMLGRIMVCRNKLREAESEDWEDPISLWRAAASIGQAEVLCRYAVWAANTGDPSVNRIVRLSDLWPYLSEQERLLGDAAQSVVRGEKPDIEALVALDRSLLEAGFPIRIESEEDWVTLGRAVESLLDKSH